MNLKNVLTGLGDLGKAWANAMAHGPKGLKPPLGLAPRGPGRVPPVVAKPVAPSASAGASTSSPVTGLGVKGLLAGNLGLTGYAVYNQGRNQQQNQNQFDALGQQVGGLGEQLGDVGDMTANSVEQLHALANRPGWLDRQLHRARSWYAQHQPWSERLKDAMARSNIQPQAPVTDTVTSNSPDYLRAWDSYAPKQSASPTIPMPYRPTVSPIVPPRAPAPQPTPAPYRSPFARATARPPVGGTPHVSPLPRQGAVAPWTTSPHVSPLPRQGAVPPRITPPSAPNQPFPSAVHEGDPDYTSEMAADDKQARDAAYQRGQSGQLTGVAMNEGYINSMNRQQSLLSDRDDRAAEFLKSGPKYPYDASSKQFSPLAGDAAHFQGMNARAEAEDTAYKQRFAAGLARQRAEHPQKVLDANNRNPQRSQLFADEIAAEGVPPSQVTPQMIRDREIQLEKKYQNYRANNAGNPDAMNYSQFATTYMINPASVPEADQISVAMQRRMAEREAYLQQRHARRMWKLSYFETPTHLRGQEEVKLATSGALDYLTRFTPVGAAGDAASWAGHSADSLVNWMRGDNKSNLGGTIDRWKSPGRAVQSLTGVELPESFSEWGAEKVLGPRGAPENQAWADASNMAHAPLDAGTAIGEWSPNPATMAAAMASQGVRDTYRPWTDRLGTTANRVYQGVTGDKEPLSTHIGLTNQLLHDKARDTIDGVASYIPGGDMVARVPHGVLDYYMPEANLRRHTEAINSQPLPGNEQYRQPFTPTAPGGTSPGAPTAPASSYVGGAATPAGWKAPMRLTPAKGNTWSMTPYMSNDEIKKWQTGGGVSLSGR